MKVWDYDVNKPIKADAYAKINLRRLYLMLQDNQFPPKYLKLSRRSRRRWRGKYGGLYTYPQNMLDLFNEAKKRYEEANG